MTAIPDDPETTTHPPEIVLSTAAFDRLIADLAIPAQVVPELAELFRRNPKLPSAER